MSDTIIGALIGVCGVLIGLIFNLLSDRLRFSYEDHKELKQKRSEVYLNILEIIDYAQHGIKLFISLVFIHYFFPYLKLKKTWSVSTKP